MARKVHGGIVGGSGLGGLSATDTTITARENDNIVFDPTGTGVLQIDGNTELLRQSALRFTDLDSSNYVAFQSPTTVTSNVTWTLPAEDGAVTQALVTNGAGILSWAAAGATVSDQTVSASTFYPLFFNATTGTASAVNVASSKLTFIPSSGQLSATLYNETSSITLKENLVPMENSLAKILGLQAYTYDRKDGSSRNEPGLIAEEVNEIIPEVVSKSIQGKPESIAYQRLVTYLIEAVKSLDKEITQLKNNK